ncbi:MAG: archaeosortase/exosortase family protein [Myxococcota bacterium]
MTREAPSESLWTHPAAPWLVWGGLIVAFSPVLSELVGHWLAHPWSRVSIIFPWLAWVAVREDQGRPGRASRPIIWTCMLVALLTMLIAISGDAIRFGRIALAVGGAGMIAGAGWARLTASIVLAFSVPTPNALLKSVSPGLESALAKGVAAVVPGLQVETTVRTAHWVSEGERFLIDHTDTGIAMGVGLAGLGWFQTVVTGGEWKDAIRRAALWFLAAIPVQFVILGVVAFCLGVLGRADMARGILNEAGWLIVFLLGIHLSLQALREPAPVAGEALSC